MTRQAIRSCVVIGSGGHARVVIACLRLMAGVRVVAAVDPDPKRHGLEVDGVPIVGGDEDLASLRRRGVRHFVVGVGGTGDNRIRQKLFALGLRQKLQPLPVVHPSAICAAGARLGAGVQLLAGSIVNVGAVIGDNVIVNTGAIVEHDCSVGAHVHLATGSLLCGGVQIGAGAHVGAGAVVRQGGRVGARAIVGAGAVVVKPVPAGAVVVGVPARPLEPS